MSNRATMNKNLSQSSTISSSSIKSSNTSKKNRKNYQNTSKPSSPTNINRSVTDLHETGKYNAIIDSIQYFIDGILLKSTNSSVKYQYAETLFNRVESNIQLIHVIRYSQYFPTLLKYLGKILYDMDSVVNVYIGLLALSLCTNDNGGFDEFIELPIEFLIGIIQVAFISSKISMNYMIKTIDTSSIPSFAKKRKRTGITTNNSDSQSSQDELIFGHAPTVIGNDYQKSLLSLLYSKKYASFMEQMRFSNQQLNPDYLSKQIALTICNRCFVSKAQNFSTLLDSRETKEESECQMICVSLADLQDALSLEYDNCDSQLNDKYDATYLDVIIEPSYDMLVSMISHLESNQSTHNDNQLRWLLFHYLTILEAASYRNITIQDRLSQYKHQSGNLINVLSDLIKILTERYLLKYSIQSNIDKKTNKSSLNNLLVNLYSELRSEVCSDDCNDTSERICVRVNFEDLFLVCIRLLVNIFHGNKQACHTIALDYKGKDYHISTYIHAFESCNLLWENACNNDRYNLLLSEQENYYDRLLYDSRLFILTLLGNICEIDPETVPIMASFQIRQYKSSSAISNTIEGPRCFLEYLLEMLLHETRSIIKDIEEVDRIEGNQTSERCTTANQSEDLPVAEIIITAHVTMLLVGLLKNPKLIHEIPKVTTQLPKQSFWLLIRILKAFIVLQGKTGVLLRENMNSVLAYISFLESYDNSSSTIEHDQKDLPVRISDESLEHRSNLNNHAPSDDWLYSQSNDSVSSASKSSAKSNNTINVGMFNNSKRISVWGSLQSVNIKRSTTIPLISHDSDKVVLSNRSLTHIPSNDRRTIREEKIHVTKNDQETDSKINCGSSSVKYSKSIIDLSNE